MEIMNIIVAGSLMVVGLTTVGYAGAVGGWVNNELFTVPMINLTVTPLALMGLVPLSLGLGMLFRSGDVLDIREEVLQPAAY